MVSPLSRCHAGITFTTINAEIAKIAERAKLTTEERRNGGYEGVRSTDGRRSRPVCTAESTGRMNALNRPQFMRPVDLGCARRFATPVERVSLRISAISAFIVVVADSHR